MNKDRRFGSAFVPPIRQAALGVRVDQGDRTGAHITTEAVIALSQHGTLAPSIIHNRADFASSMVDGRTVMEIPRKSPSANEIVELWAYLSVRMNRLFHRAAPTVEEPRTAYS